VGKEMFSFEEHGFTSLDTSRRTLLTLNAEGPLRSLNPGLHIARFLEALALSIEKAEVRRTPEVLAALRDIPPLRDKVLDAVEKALDDDVRVYWAAIQQLAKNVRLGDQLTLRPEATASVCRAYIEHNMHALPQPVKLYYTGPMFRRERPQKGRYRQFYQIGAEVLEALQPNANPSKDIFTDAVIDAELIEMLMVFFQKVGLHG